VTDLRGAAAEPGRPADPLVAVGVLMAQATQDRVEGCYADAYRRLGTPSPKRPT
jgi:hypothetical protein